MWNLKYDTNELIFETETDSQAQKTDMWLPTGRGVDELDWKSCAPRSNLEIVLHIVVLARTKVPVSVLHHVEVQLVELEHIGFEPMVPCLQSRCVTSYANAPRFRRH